MEYTYGKDARGWHWTELDDQTGQKAKKMYIPLSKMLGGAWANNFYGGITIGPDGTAYAGALGGSVALLPGPAR
jgi:hypothetical protein